MTVDIPYCVPDSNFMVQYKKNLPTERSRLLAGLYICVNITDKNLRDILRTRFFKKYKTVKYIKVSLVSKI